jgi:hypothetical protein
VLARCRDGAERSYFVWYTMWGCCPATLIDYSSRLWLAATIDAARCEEKAPASEGGRYKFGRRESRTSRRFAPGLREHSQEWLSNQEASKNDSCDEYGRRVF